MIYKRLLPLLLIFLYSGNSSAAQKCSANGDTNNTSFSVNSDATVSDGNSSLIWWRCPLGMKLDAKTQSCKGVAIRHSWADAKFAMEDINANAGFAGSRNWRLPTLSELQMLVDSHCFDPSLDSEIFPDTPPTGFWTSTPNKNVERNAWLVFFLHGSTYTGNTVIEWAIRPVRSK